MEKRMNEMKEFQERGVQIEQQACRRRNKRVRFRFHPLLRLRNDSINPLAPRRESKPSETCSLAPRGRGLGRGGQERCRLSRGEVSSQNRGGKTSNRKAAFTLAEVLITLGIIGVVAAMTLPSLIQNYQKKALATQTQKFYSTMSQAVKQYMTDYGVDDLRNTPLASDNYEVYDTPEAIASIRDFVTKYLKVVKECESIEDEDDAGRTLYNGCLAPAYRWPDNSGELKNYNYWAGYRNYVLADGSVITIGYFNMSERNHPAPILLGVDVNGKKGPNKFGYDYFEMSIFYDGVIDESMLTPECRKEGKCGSGDAHTAAELREAKFEYYCSSIGYAGCFGHLLNNNFKFDY